MLPDMNQLFNLTRFGKVFVKHTAEHYKSYLMSLTVLIGVMVLGGSFIVFVIPGGFLYVQLQSSMFVVILMLAGTIFTSTIFADFGNKNKAIASLTLPASHLEKYLVAWLYSLVIFTVVFTCSFYLILLFLINLQHIPVQKAGIFNVFQKPVGLQVFLLYAFLNAITLFGAILFEKLHFIKTAFAFFISAALLILFNKTLLGILLGRDVMAAAPFTNASFVEHSKGITISTTGIEESHIIIPMLIITLIFWIAAYYRLKEKQV